MTRNASNDGRSFEKSIETICGIYERQGRAAISKVEPPCRIFGGRVIFMRNPFLDFTGCWTENGNRTIHFEAKSTSSPLLKCEPRNGFSQTQRDALKRWRDAGAATWLLWEYDGKVRIWFQSMIDVALSERRSLAWADGIDVAPGKGFVFFDFLATVKRYEANL